MALTIVKSLDSVCPVENPMKIIVSTDNQYSTAGVLASLSLLFSSIDVTPGDRLSFTWNGQTQTMILAGVPDDSGNQMHAAEVGQTLADWIAVLVEDLESNYYLSRDFDISIDGYTTIVLQAKLPGSKYTLDFSGTIPGVTQNPDPVEGVDPELRPYYRIGLQVYSLPDNSLLGEDLVTPDSSGESAFDIHDLLCDYLTPEFEWPQPSDSNYVTRDNFIRKFFVRYGETYDRRFRKMTELAGDHYAILGGFDYKALAGLMGTSFNISSFVLSQKGFLSWQPFEKLISTAQKEKLFFLNLVDARTIKSFFKIYFTDGTSSTAIESDSIAASVYTVYEFFTGYQALDIASNLSGKTPYKYDFWLEDGDAAVISRTMTYLVDFREYAFERTFLFRNSFGAYDLFRTTGRKKNVNKYERMILERNYEEIAVSVQYQILEEETFSVNSGFISKATKNWLRELLMSEDVYELIGDYAFPILIQNSDVENFDDRQTLYDLDIAYKYAFKNSKYSGQVNLTPLLAENLNALLTEDGDYIFS